MGFLHPAHIHGQHSIIAVIHPIRVLRLPVLWGIFRLWVKLPLTLDLLGEALVVIALLRHIAGVELLLVGVQHGLL